MCVYPCRCIWFMQSSFWAYLSRNSWKFHSSANSLQVAYFLIRRATKKVTFIQHLRQFDLALPCSLFPIQIVLCFLRPLAQPHQCEHWNRPQRTASSDHRSISVWIRFSQTGQSSLKLVKASFSASVRPTCLGSVDADDAYHLLADHHPYSNDRPLPSLHSHYVFACLSPHSILHTW